MNAKGTAENTITVEAPGPGGPDAFLPKVRAESDAGPSRARAWPWGWWFAGLGLAAAISSLVQILAGFAERGLFVLVLCYVVCVCAAWVDAAMRRVPNLLTYPAILAGLALNGLVAPVLASLDAAVALRWLGSPGWSEGLLGFLLCAGFGIMGFAARGLGGGDVKLLAAVGALLGLSAVISVLCNALIIAAVIGIVNFALRGELVARVQVISLGLLQFAATKRGIARVYPFQAREAPFCPSVLLGLILSHFVALHEQLLEWIR